MIKLEITVDGVKETIKELKLYRRGWANDIREGWNFSQPDGRDIVFSLYEISGSIILSLEDVLIGRFRDKMALHLVKRRLDQLVSSKEFRIYDELGQAGACDVVTNGTKHHIRVMTDTLEILTA